MLILPFFVVASIHGVLGARSSVSRSGRCGSEHNGLTCAGSSFGSCCSSYSWCGTTPDHCGKGCQPGYGNCKSSSPPPNPAFPSSVKSTLSSVVVPSKLASSSCPAVIVTMPGITQTVTRPALTELVTISVSQGVQTTTLTLPGKATTVTSPGDQEIVTVTIPTTIPTTVTISIPGDGSTATVSGDVITVTVPADATTVTLPGEVTTVTLPVDASTITLPTTVTLPGEATTVTLPAELITQTCPTLPASTTTVTTTTTATPTSLPDSNPSCSAQAHAIQNHGFETGLLPWVALAPGDAILDRISSSSGFALRARNGATNNLGSNIVQVVSLCPGTTYRLSFTARRVTSAGTVSAVGFVQVGSSTEIALAGGIISSATFAVVPPINGGTFTVPQGVTNGLVRIGFTYAGMSGALKELHVDDVTLVVV